MQGLDEIPTLPNSPAQPFAVATHSPSPALSMGEWSEIDMMSSIESLNTRPRSLLHPEPSAPPHPLSQPSPAQPSSPQSEIQHDTQTNAMPRALEGHTSSTAEPSWQDYGFIMPSLPQIIYGAEDPVVGQLRLAVSGARGKQVLTVIGAQMFDDRSEVRDDGIESYICSSSPSEHGNVVLLDANFVPKEVPKWLESQLQHSSPVDAVIYTLSSTTPADEDIVAMQEIQKLAELVVVIADNDNDRESDVNLENLGIASFHKRTWHISTLFERNWEMNSSCVEAPGYRSMIPVSHQSELEPLVTTLLRSSGRLRATASMIQAKWFQSQLVVTLTEPSGALAHHVNLRRKTQLASIGNLDPLGLAHWSTIPKVTAAIVAGFVGGVIAALGVSGFLPAFISSTSVPPPKRHALLDVENWPQWLI